MAEPTESGRKSPRGVFERAKGSGVWWISYRGPDGKRHREKVGRFQAAVDLYLSRRIAIREDRFEAPRASSITLRELFELAFDDRKLRLAPSTLANDDVYRNWWVERLGELPSRKITATMIGAGLRELRETGRSGSSVNRYKATISAVFTWGMKNDDAEGHRYVRYNPAREAEGYRENEQRVRFLELGEEAALRKAIREDYPECEAELDVALHTGMRRNELYRLTWDRVDLDRRIVTIEGKRRANSTESSRRFVRLDSVAAAALTELYETSDGSAYVCPGFRRPDRREVDRREWFEACVEKAKIDNFRFHDLRHTFASRLVMAGVPMAAVKEMMGHRTMAMTDRYSHLAPDHQLANIEKLATEYPASSAVRRVPAVRITRSAVKRT